mmetsp:Transcript_20800/g.52405  ORF Transcript_20800/g.52405 Transcript_20800/m.52405 type:complete len:203 (+) Transcript_20800:1475-2083(+)
MRIVSSCPAFRGSPGRPSCGSSSCSTSSGCEFIASDHDDCSYSGSTSRPPPRSAFSAIRHHHLPKVSFNPTTSSGCHTRCGRCATRLARLYTWPETQIAPFSFRRWRSPSEEDERLAAFRLFSIWLSMIPPMEMPTAYTFLWSYPARFHSFKHCRMPLRQSCHRQACHMDVELCLSLLPPRPRAARQHTANPRLKTKCCITS